MPFKCTKCGYGEANKGSGIPFKCPVCKEPLSFIRIEWEEYYQLEITDGEDKS